MQFPFTTQEFLEVFKNYNLAVWPVQILFLLVAIFIIIAVSKFIVSGKTIVVVMSLFWIWMGTVYHLLFFSSINKAAFLFGGIFILQGLLFLFYAFKKSPAFELKGNIYGIIAAVLAVFAIVIYPVIGYFSGHIYPYSPTFGLPCPTTIFTFAILLLSKRHLPFYLLIIPLAWSLVGFSAAMFFGMYEDIGLILSAVIFSVLILLKRKKTEVSRSIGAKVEMA